MHTKFFVVYPQQKRLFARVRRRSRTVLSGSWGHVFRGCGLDSSSLERGQPVVNIVMKIEFP